LEIITPVIQDDAEEDGDEAEALLVVPIPEPVPSSEEEEETLEVVCSYTPLLGHEPVPQVHGQLSSLVGLCAILLTVPNLQVHIPWMGVDEFAVRTMGICPSILAALLEVPFPMGVGIRTRGIIEGAIQLSKVMARLQLATVAIATAKAVGMEGDLDDLMSLEEDSMAKAKEDRPRISS